jgi:hypothetical protein
LLLRTSVACGRLALGRMASAQAKLVAGAEASGRSVSGDVSLEVAATKASSGANKAGTPESKDVSSLNVVGKTKSPGLRADAAKTTEARLTKVTRAHCRLYRRCALLVLHPKSPRVLLKDAGLTKDVRAAAAAGKTKALGKTKDRAVATQTSGVGKTRDGGARAASRGLVTSGEPAAPTTCD